MTFKDYNGFFDTLLEMTNFTKNNFRYAKAAVAFMVNSRPDDFDSSDVLEQIVVLGDLKGFTATFLAPFESMRLLEQNDEDTSSPWIIEAQKILSGASENGQAKISSTNELVGFTQIGGVKPTIEGVECEEAIIKTFGHNSYPLDPLDFGGLISADVTKAKFKLEDIVKGQLCEDVSEQRRQCADVNRVAFEVALSIASEETRSRYLNQGKQLVFGDDSISPWGPGWEFSTGLKYKDIDAKTVEIVSTSLISEPDFIISSAAGMHYCDLLSPYRALEWIYITGVQHG